MAIIRFILLGVVLSVSVPAAAVIVSLPLTLSPVEDDTNRLTFDVAAFNLSDSDTTDLTGSVDAQLELSLSPTEATVTGVRFDGGMVDASDLDFDFGFFVTLASIDGRDLGGEVLTPTSGFSNVIGGSFPTEDHVLRINRGTLKGSLLASAIDVDLAAEPIELTQVGTATVELLEMNSDGNQRTYKTTMTLPVDAVENLEITPEEAAVVQVAGAIVATGTFEVDLPFAGDYTGDGTVNIADYTLWRDNLGAAEGTLLNDVDGGTIGAAQYNTWKANFGNTAPAASAFAGTQVPEPSAMMLLTVSGIAALSCRFRPTNERS